MNQLMEQLLTLKTSIAKYNNFIDNPYKEVIALFNELEVV